jgi:beta-glucanase (GH16 family)
MITKEEVAELHKLIDDWYANQQRGPTAGKKITFLDTFTDNTVNWNVWDSQYWYSPANGTGCNFPKNGALEWNINHRNNDILYDVLQPWKTSQNGLVLRAALLPDYLIPKIGYDQEDARTMGQMRYSSGLIQNKKSFAQKYGYFEMLCKLPSGKGLWPAFWLMPSNGNRYPEIDIFELLGHEPNKIYTTQHTDEGSMHIEAWEQFTTKFNKIGLEWDEHKLTLYVNDNVAGGGIIPNKSHEPMYMIANLAVGGHWPGNPDEHTPMPAEFEIKHIKAYQYV